MTIGGGYSFVSNLTKGLMKMGHTVGNVDAADTILIPSPTLAQRDDVRKWKNQGKRIVLRIDNAVRNSRNRGTGMPRMRDFAQWADAVIYQSKWARALLRPYLKVDGEVIYNSIDERVFINSGEKHELHKMGDPVYLYSRYNRDDGKMWIRVWYEYQKIQQLNPEAFLIIVGRYSDQLREYNFDFFNNENFKYIGVIDNPLEMASVYRAADLLFAVYYNDCFSNTYLEALMCGCELTSVDISGGTPELLRLFDKHGPTYFYLERMCSEYLNILKP